MSPGAGLPARFSSLSCGYCNEYEKVSESVQLKEMYRRIDHLGRLRAAMIGISGGEPPIRSHQGSKPASANPWGQLSSNAREQTWNFLHFMPIFCRFRVRIAVRGRQLSSASGHHFIIRSLEKPKQDRFTHRAQSNRLTTASPARTFL